MGGEKGKVGEEEGDGCRSIFQSFSNPPPCPDNDFSHVFSVRKAAKREILLCDFEGCGKIFSNRQYLNVSTRKDQRFLERCEPGWGVLELELGADSLVFFPWQHHQKYQHVHQKTFTCSEPTCGKSFNFKKHLKEHEKLHSGEWGISTPPALWTSPPWTSSRMLHPPVWMVAPLLGITSPCLDSTSDSHLLYPPSPLGHSHPLPNSHSWKPSLGSPDLSLIVSIPMLQTLPAPKACP